MKRWGILFLLVGCLACAEDASESRYATLHLAVEGCPELSSDRSLSDSGTCSFQVSVHEGDWLNSPPPAVFQSGCEQYRGDRITVSNFPAGSPLTVYLRTFSDAECVNPVLQGARGGVEVLEGTDAPGIWYVPTFSKSAITAFPSFNDALYAAAEATSCSSDDDCLKQEGGVYEISPVARCNEESQRCELPASTFPLNLGGPRAFHSATRLENGHIVLVGGLARQESSGGFLATDETVEVFDPVHMVWSKPEIEGLSGKRLAMHTAVPLGGNRLGLFGGVRQLQFAFSETSQASGDRRHLSITVPQKDVTQSDNISNLVYAVDVANGSSEVGTLGVSPRVGAHAIRVPGGVLVTGGLQPVLGGEGVVHSNFGDLCDLSGTPDCEAHAPLSTDRAFHCGFCLDDSSSDDCERVFFFGGMARDLENSAATVLGEIYDSNESASTPVGLLESDIETNVVFPTCARGSKNNYLLGGSEQTEVAPSVLPVLLGLTNGDQQVGAVDLEGVGGTVSPFRIHSTATPLLNGQVLVTGGLDDNGRPVGVAYVVDGARIVDQKTMVTARFGHTATLVTTGPMRGAVLIVGGMTLNDDDELVLATSAELYLP